MPAKSIYNFFLWSAMFGNAIFFIWITYNGIDEGFAGTLPEKASYLGLSALLILNLALLWPRKTR